ncbi:hypothetical protein GCM10010121_087770 [Streptomyces brasiliensis]|uniref:Uncharacterized protein n=1 Tax=Streptomyces brasiliensis TaxID=1954 RepID=A0A917UKE1_9ACTN|nr:hypothetical protein GCM10010121_087770 [Streptomyces brasiliensis]
MIDAVATDSNSTPSNDKPRRARRTRMTGPERRHQLLETGRTIRRTVFRVRRNKAALLIAAA